MRYVTVPNEIRLSDIKNMGSCFSPSKYIRFIPPISKNNSTYCPLDKLLIFSDSKIKIEKNEIYYYSEIGDIDINTGGVVFRKFRGFQLPSKKLLDVNYGNILISTVRTYRMGIAFINDNEENLVASNAFLNLIDATDYIPNINLYYVYSFLRSEFFIEQVWSILNRGLYPRLDNNAFDKIFIPIPNNVEAIKYITELTKAIIDKEKKIRERSSKIYELIESELLKDQKKDKQFIFQFPTLTEIKRIGRLDAAIYDIEYKKKINLILNYKNGYKTPKQMGFKITPGPSLEIKILKTRLDSNTCKPNFYGLILPTNISSYGTMKKISYLGTGKNLPLLKKGDIIFGESGNHRSVVLIDFLGDFTTNAHGLYARHEEDDIVKSIFFRCFYDWLYKNNVIDLLSVGGSGGHFSPEYFEKIIIPDFPEGKQKEIAQLYHNSISFSEELLNVSNFRKYHQNRNEYLGIWELDYEMKKLKMLLMNIQHKIIKGEKTDNSLFNWDFCDSSCKPMDK